MLGLSPPISDHILRKKRVVGSNLPVAILYDNFDSGANGATVAGRAPLLRPNSNNWAVTNEVVTNNGKVEIRFSSATNGLLRHNTGLVDIDVSVDMVFPSTGNNRSAGVLFHYVGATSYLYTLANLDNSVFRIIARVSGVDTVLAQIAYTFTPGVTYRMRLVYVDDIVFSTIEGIGTISVNLADYDAANATTLVSTFGAATVHGLRGGNQSGQGAIVFDNIHFVDPPPPADVYISVNPVSTFTSLWEPSVSHVDNRDLRLANSTARTRAIQTLTNVFMIHHQPMVSFGSSDPWPWDGSGTRPPAPTNWNSLISMSNYIRQMGGQMMITTDFIPWHLKGRVQADGSITPCLPGETFDKDGRVMVEEIDNWLLLVETCAEIFMAEPHNVRHWCTGIEYHGDLRGIELDFNPIAWHGTIGPNNDVGASYMHNLTVTRLKEVATRLGIPLEEFEWIPNYPRLRASSTRISASVPIDHPLADMDWGVAEEPGFEAVREMALLVDDDSTAWSCDFSISNIDGVLPNAATPFECLEKITDYLEFLKTDLASVGIVGKKIVVNEKYVNVIPAPPDAGNILYRMAMEAEALRRFILAGVWMVIHWSIQGRDMDGGYELLGALVSDMRQSTGGAEQGVLTVVKMFAETLSAGTAIHDVTIHGSGVSAIASDEIIILINQTDEDQTVRVDNATHVLSGYEVAKYSR